MSVFEKVSDNFSTFKNLAQPLFTKAKYKIDDNVKMLSDLIQLNQLCIHFRMENILTAKATAMENKTQGLTFLLLDL